MGRFALISADRVNTAVRLLRAGESQRGVARQTGLARGTVAVIAAGKHPRQRLGVWAPDFGESTGAPDPQRCPSCGRLVRPPCLVCEVQGRHRRRSARRLLVEMGQVVEPLGLQLRPAEYVRYL